jgi:serine/threonine protein kinase
MLPDPFYCSNCGAANDPNNIVCTICRGSLTQSADTEEPPLILHERYRIIKQVGSGGFSVVYQAVDTHQAEMSVAIKQINLRDLSAQEMIEATEVFHREIRLLSGLKHPRLPRMHDSFTDPDHWYLVMDFIDGTTLDTYLQQRFPTTTNYALPIHEALEIGLQLCDVLDYLHQQTPPIIFRDLKPANIMRTANGQYYLIDFGIARHFRPGKQKDTIPLGSPGYAPPEQYGKAQTTPRADIYGLGALLHQLLSGNDPSETPFSFAPLQLTGLQEARGLADLIQRMVNLDISQRPESIGEVKEQLQSYSDLLDVQEPRIWRPGTPQPLPADISSYQRSVLAGTNQPTSRRSALMAILVGTGVVGLSCMGMYYASFLARPRFSGTITIPRPSPTYVDHRIWRGHSGAITALAWSPDGRLIVSGSADKTIKVWRGTDGALLYTFYGYTAPVTSVTWSPDDMCVASSGDDDGSVQVWEALNGHMDATHQGQRGRVLALDWSQQNSQYVVSGGDDQRVQVWNAADGKTAFTYTGHSDSVRTVVYGASGVSSGWIASGGADQTVQTWEPATGKIVYIYKGHTAPVNALTWTTNMVVSASDDGSVHVHKPEYGSVKKIYRGHRGKVYAVTHLYTPDNTFVASAGDDRQVHIWNTLTGNLVFQYKQHAAPIRALASSPRLEYMRAVSGSDDGMIHLWSLPDNTYTYT